MKISVVFPHQLFEKSVLLENNYPVYLLEESLFFSQYNFHKQKLVYHRASMTYYESYLSRLGLEVHYIDAQSKKHDVRIFISELSSVKEIHCVNPVDDWLESRMKQACAEKNIKLVIEESPQFLNTEGELESFFKPTRKKFYQTKFYTEQRLKRNILLDQNSKPLGGKWTYDTENRKKYPIGKIPPVIYVPEHDSTFREAIDYVNKYYSNNYGSSPTVCLYPYTHKTAREWLKQFLEIRFYEFGPYEDAIVKEELVLNHSLLTPLLNSGLLTPSFVLEEAITYGKKYEIPLNSLEGFVRQVMGWREFIRGIYRAKGREERTKNYWGFSRKIPSSFYNGTTGIEPIDLTIKKVLETGYCHHIERLMVLGNFMLLCEFSPDEVYKWFMELFIDAYDWVMVTNVYGMSQFADGGLMSTKPYISGSNYLMKMSNYKKGNWQNIWDGLFWKFMDKHRTFFLKNPRLGMLVRTYDKMDDEKKRNLHSQALTFLTTLE